MKDKVPFFPQHTLETCGPACILMLLHYFEKRSYANAKDKKRKNSRDQLEIYMKNRSEVRRAFFRGRDLLPEDDRAPGVTAAQAAKYLAEQDLSVQLIHSSGDYMENRLCWFDPENEVHWEYADQGKASRTWEPYYDGDLFADMHAEYSNLVSQCLQQYAGSQDKYSVSIEPDMTYHTLKEELDKGRKLMVQTIIPGDADGIHSHVLHWILVTGYEKHEKDGEDVFLAMDPLFGETTFAASELENYCNTPIGRICISVGEWTP